MLLQALGPTIGGKNHGESFEMLCKEHICWYFDIFVDCVNVEVDNDVEFAIISDRAPNPDQSLGAFRLEVPIIRCSSDDATVQSRGATFVSELTHIRGISSLCRSRPAEAAVVIRFRCFRNEQI